MVGGEFDWNTQGMAFVQSGDAQPVVEGAVLRRFDDNHVGIGLDAGDAQDWEIPFVPGGFMARRIRVLLLGLFPLPHLFQVGVVGGLSVGAPGFRDACRLLDGDALIPLRKLAWNAWVSIPVWGRSRRAEGGDILLAERLVGRCQLVESI